jgi:hypothetical protein
MSSITGSLRATTKAQTARVLSKPAKYGGRRYIPIESAPSQTLPDGHICEQIHPEYAEDKSQNRLLMTAIRFYVTHVLHTHTYRGQTALQAGKSTCGGCESAHFALTPSMHDGKMQEIINSLAKRTPLSDISLDYINHRLGLSKEEAESFSELSPTEQLHYLEDHMARDDRHSSFSNTSYETQLSGTIQGSIFANDFDQILEKKLRPIEDALSSQIYQEETDPQSALLEMYAKTCELFTTSIKHLETRKEQLQKYKNLESQLKILEESYPKHTTDQERVLTADQFADLAKQLLDVKNELLSKLESCVNFDKKHLSEITDRGNFNRLDHFVTQYGLQKDEKGKISCFEDDLPKMSFSPKYGSAFQKVDMILGEAVHQFEGVQSIGECHLKNMTYWLFGIAESNVRRPPTEEELHQQILEMTRKEKTSLKRKRGEQ